MQKSIKVNMILNGIKGLLSVLFPLITFPYVSKILGVENIGKYNFASSIINYFTLLAGLGISTYAIREGARIRDDKDNLNKFCKEMFTINIISTIISYLLLIILLFLVPKFHSYTVLLLILSLQIIFSTFGIEWIYSIYEDFKFITIRSIVFQLLGLILMFSFVHTKNDLYVYAIITVIASVGSNIINFFYSKKYCNVSITKKFNLKKHIKPIMVLFATTVAVTIYVNSDITVLGFLTNDYHVGIYSVSTKIYTIIKSLLASIVTVTIPRFSSLLSKKKNDEFKETAEEVYKILLTVVIPSIVGIICLRKEIILIIAGESYLDAQLSLAILSVAMIICLGAYFYGQAMLVPLKQENKVLKITIVSAFINIVLNFILIPFWKENAAAFTTLLAELIAFLYCKYETKKIIKLDSFVNVFIKCVVGCIPIIFIDLIIKKLFNNFIIATVLIVILSVIAYLIVEIILKNDIVLYYLNKIKSKFKMVDNVNEKNN